MSGLCIRSGTCFMKTEIDTVRRYCLSTPAEQVMSGTISVISDSARKLNEDPSPSDINRNKLKTNILKGGLLVACLVSITIVTIGAAAITAIDGLATINRPEFLSKLPLTIILMVSAISGAGIVYLMVQILLAMGDDVDFGD